jgi:hypothetical protein
MSYAVYKRIATLLALLSVPILTGCGSSDPTNRGPVGSTPGGIAGPGACIPITNQIPFTATNVQYVPRKIVVNLGQAVVGGPVGIGGPYQGTNLTGSIIALSMTPTQPVAQVPAGYPIPSYPMIGYGTIDMRTPQMVNASGFVQISPIELQNIMAQAQLGSTPVYSNPGYPYPMQPTLPALPNPQQICVSGIAFSLNIALYSTKLHIGDVALYLNNTQTPHLVAF